MMPARRARWVGVTSLGDIRPPGMSSGRGYTRAVPTKDPHVVLGIEPGASPDEIKASWRALARRHHPDLTGDDPESAQRATRRMAEINAAYAALTRSGETIEGQRRGDGASPTGGGRSARGGAGFGQEDAGGRGQRAYTGAGT